MAEEINFENGRNSNFEGLVTLTLTFDPAIRHIVLQQSSTSTYIPNFIQIEETFCGRTDVRTYGRTDIFPSILLGRLSEVDLIIYCVLAAKGWIKTYTFCFRCVCRHCCLPGLPYFPCSQQSAVHRLRVFYKCCHGCIRGVQVYRVCRALASGKLASFSRHTNIMCPHDATATSANCSSKRLGDITAILTT